MVVEAVEEGMESVSSQKQPAVAILLDSTVAVLVTVDSAHENLPRIFEHLPKVAVEEAVLGGVWSPNDLCLSDLDFACKEDRRAVAHIDHCTRLSMGTSWP